MFLPFTSHRGERYQTSISPSLQKTYIKLSKLFPWIPIHLTWGDRDVLYFLPPKVRESKCHITPTIIPPKLPHPFLYNTPTPFIKITIRKRRSELMLVISYYYLFTRLTKVFRTIRMMEQWKQLYCSWRLSLHKHFEKENSLIIPPITLITYQKMHEILWIKNIHILTLRALNLVN